MARCQFCEKRFEVGSHKHLFCSTACRIRHNQDQENVCFYCNEVADTKDHITPRSFQRDPNNEVVNCCLDCNVILGNRYPSNLPARIEYLREALHKRGRLDKPIPQWDDEELDEMGYSLRVQIESARCLRETYERRYFNVTDRLLQVRSLED